MTAKNLTEAGIVEELSAPLDIAITVVHNYDPEWDWWTIERAEHPNESTMEPTRYGSSLRYSGRISDACVEGDSTCMLAVANAIERGVSYGEKRCAAEHSPEGYRFSSPRNSRHEALVPHERAKALAADIRAKVKPPAKDVTP